MVGSNKRVIRKQRPPWCTQSCWVC